MRPALEIWYLRHGETEWNRTRRWQGHSDTPLNDLGRWQAARLGARLGSLAFDRVYSSDLSRCLETAGIAVPRVEPIVDPRLREIDYGAFEGCTWDTLADEERLELETWWGDPYQLRIRGGESFTDVTERLREWQRDLPEQGRIAVFSHGGLIRCALYQVIGAPRGWEWTVMLENGGITRIRADSRHTAILGVNDCGHLQEADFQGTKPGPEAEPESRLGSPCRSQPPGR